MKIPCTFFYYDDIYMKIRQNHQEKYKHVKIAVMHCLGRELDTRVRAFTRGGPKLNDYKSLYAPLTLIILLRSKWTEQKRKPEVCVNKDFGLQVQADTGRYRQVQAGTGRYRQVHAGTGR